MPDQFNAAGAVISSRRSLILNVEGEKHQWEKRLTTKPKEPMLSRAEKSGTSTARTRRARSASHLAKQELPGDYKQAHYYDRSRYQGVKKTQRVIGSGQTSNKDLAMFTKWWAATRDEITDPGVLQQKWNWIEKNLNLFQLDYPISNLGRTVLPESVHEGRVGGRRVKPIKQWTEEEIRECWSNVNRNQPENRELIELLALHAGVRLLLRSMGNVSDRKLLGLGWSGLSALIKAGVVDVSTPDAPRGIEAMLRCTSGLLAAKPVAPADEDLSRCATVCLHGLSSVVAAKLVALNDPGPYFQAACSSVLAVLAGPPGLQGASTPSKPELSPQSGPDEQRNKRPLSRIWNVINITRTLAGLKKALELGIAKPPKDRDDQTPEAKTYRDFKTACNRMLEMVALGDDPAWVADVRAIANAWSYLGDLWEASPPVFVDEQKVRRVMQRMLDRTIAAQSRHGWTPIHVTQVLGALGSAPKSGIVKSPKDSNDRAPEAKTYRDFEKVCDWVLEPLAVHDNDSDWHHRALANAWSYLSDLLEADPPVFSNEGKLGKAIQRLLDLTLKLGRWDQPMHITQVLGGLSRTLKLGKVSPSKDEEDTSEAKIYRTFKTACDRMIDALCIAGDDREWNEQNVANAWLYLGELLKADPPVFSDEGKVRLAIQRMLDRTIAGRSLHGWRPISLRQVLFSLGRVLKSKKVKAPERSNDKTPETKIYQDLKTACELSLNALMSQGKDSEWDEVRVSDAWWLVADLLVAADPPVLSNENKTLSDAIRRLVGLTHATPSDIDGVPQSARAWKPREIAGVLRGVSIVFDLPVLGIDFSPALRSMLGAIECLEPAAWSGRTLSRVCNSLRHLHEGAALRQNERTLAPAMQALVHAAFTGALDTANNNHIARFLPALSYFANEGLLSLDAAKAASRALLTRMQDPQLVASLSVGARINAMSLLRFAMHLGWLDDLKSEVWTEFARLWHACIAAPLGLAETARLLDEGRNVSRRWKREWPAAGDPPAVSPLAADKGEWNGGLLALAFKCEKQIVTASLKERPDLRMLCESLNALNAEVGSGLRKQIRTLLAAKAVHRLDFLLKDRITEHDFPYTSNELVLVRKYLDIVRMPIVRDMMSDVQCRELAQYVHRNLSKDPRAIEPQSWDDALGVVQLYGDGKPVFRAAPTGQANKPLQDQPGRRGQDVTWRAVSAYKRMFGDAVAAPIQVRLRLHQKAEDDMPLYIKHDGEWYRTDLFRGSGNKPKRGERTFAIGIRIKDSPFFVRYWLTSLEARCYMQRAFLFEEAQLPSAVSEVAPEDYEADDEISSIEDDELDELEIEALLAEFDDEPKGNSAQLPLASYLHDNPPGMPHDLEGKFNVCYVADAKAVEFAQKFQLRTPAGAPGLDYDKLMVQDGCGFIREDLYCRLMGLESQRQATSIIGPARPDPPRSNPRRANLPIDALQHYPLKGNVSERAAIVKEFVDLAWGKLGEKPLESQGTMGSMLTGLKGAPLFKALTSGDPLTYMGTAVPVLGNRLTLPDSVKWRKAVEDQGGFLIGRNPFDSRQLVFVPQKDIDWASALNGIVVQYSLNGFINESTEHFAKGLLMVVPTDRWPADLPKDQIVLSAKDLKTSTEFKCPDPNSPTAEADQLRIKKDLQDGKDQTFDAQGMRRVQLSGILGSKTQRCWHLIGIPKWMIDRLAGDYDGDEITLVPALLLQAFAELVRDADDPPNSKLPKTSKPDAGEGAADIDKLAQVMSGGLVNSASGLTKLYHCLTPRSLLHAWKMRRDEGLDTSLFQAIFRGRTQVMGQELVAPFDANDLTQLALVLGLKDKGLGATFDPTNLAHGLAFMERELELLHKGGTDEEKTTLDYDAFDQTRSLYWDILTSDPSVPSGVPYSKRLLGRLTSVAERTQQPGSSAQEPESSVEDQGARHKKEIKERHERIHAILTNAFEHTAYHAGLVNAILRESIRRFLKIDDDRVLLIKALEPSEGETTLPEGCAAEVRGLLSGESVGFDPHGSLEDRAAVTDALRLAAQHGDARVLYEILSSPLKLQLREFDPEQTALMAAITTGNADAVALLLDDRSTPTIPGKVELEIQSLLRDRDAAAERAAKLRADFEADPPRNRLRQRPVDLGGRVSRAEQIKRNAIWNASMLAKTFKEAQGRSIAEQVALCVQAVNDAGPEELASIPKRVLTWLISTSGKSMDESNPLVRQALNRLAECSLAEPFSWGMIDLGVRIDVLARHAHLPPCQAAVVRLAAAVPGEMSVLNDSGLSAADRGRMLEQLVNGLGQFQRMARDAPMPQSAHDDVERAITALARWVEANRTLVAGLELRHVANVLNGFGRFARISECRLSIVVLAQHATSAKGGETPEKAAMNLGSLLHGLSNCARDPTCRAAVLQLVPRVRQTTARLVAQNAAIAPLSEMPSNPSIVLGEVTVSNIAMGLRATAALCSDEQRAEIQPGLAVLAQLILAQSDQRLAAFASNSLTKLVQAFAIIAQPDPPFRQALGVLAGAVARQANTSGLSGWTALELSAVNEVLAAHNNLPSAQAAVDAIRTALARLGNECAGLAGSAEGLSGRSTQTLLADRKRLEGAPRSAEALARIDAVLAERAIESFPDVVTWAPVEVQQSQKAKEPKPQPLQVGEPLFGIRPLRTPQIEATEKQRVLLSKHSELAPYMRGPLDPCNGPKRFERTVATLPTEKQAQDKSKAESTLASTEYLFTVDQEGVRIALRREEGRPGSAPKDLKHTNLSAKACIGGTVKFHPHDAQSKDKPKVTLNASSAAFGMVTTGVRGEPLGDLTLQQWEQTVRVWEDLGYEVVSTQRLFTVEPVQRLALLLDSVDKNKRDLKTQFGRIAELLKYARLQFDGTDAPVLVGVMGALKPWLPFEGSTVLAQALLEKLTLTIEGQRDPELRFDSPSVELALQAVANLSDSKGDLAGHKRRLIEAIQRSEKLSTPGKTEPVPARLVITKPRAPAKPPTDKPDDTQSKPLTPERLGDLKGLALLEALRQTRPETLSGVPVAQLIKWLTAVRTMSSAEAAPGALNVLVACVIQRGRSLGNPNALVFELRQHKKGIDSNTMATLLSSLGVEGQKSPADTPAKSADKPRLPSTTVPPPSIESVGAACAWLKQHAGTVTAVDLENLVASVNALPIQEARSAAALLIQQACRDKWLQKPRMLECITAIVERAAPQLPPGPWGQSTHAIKPALAKELLNAVLAATADARVGVSQLLALVDQIIHGGFVTAGSLKPSDVHGAWVVHAIASSWKALPDNQELLALMARVFNGLVEVHSDWVARLSNEDSRCELLLERVAAKTALGWKVDLSSPALTTEIAAALGRRFWAPADRAGATIQFTGGKPALEAEFLKARPAVRKDDPSSSSSSDTEQELAALTLKDVLSLQQARNPKALFNALRDRHLQLQASGELATFIQAFLQVRIDTEDYAEIARRLARAIRALPADEIKDLDLIEALEALLPRWPKDGSRGAIARARLCDAIFDVRPNWACDLSTPNSRREYQEQLFSEIAKGVRATQPKAPPTGTDAPDNATSTDAPEVDILAEFLNKYPAFANDEIQEGCLFWRSDDYVNAAEEDTGIRTYEVIPPLEMQRCLRDPAVTPEPATLRVFSGPFIKKDAPYHEVQLATYCGWHALNNLNMRLSANDPSVLITKPILDEFIRERLKARLAQKAYASDTERQQALEREYKQETLEYSPEWLVEFNNAQPAGAGFNRLVAASAQLEEAGNVTLLSNTPATEPAAFGVLFDVYHAEPVPGFGKHIVSIELLEGQYVVRDSRPLGHTAEPIALGATTMQEAIGKAIALLGPPTWLRAVTSQLATAAADHDETKVQTILADANALMSKSGAMAWDKTEIESLVDSLLGAKGFLLADSVAAQLLQALPAELRGVSVFYPEAASGALRAETPSRPSKTDPPHEHRGKLPKSQESSGGKTGSDTGKIEPKMPWLDWDSDTWLSPLSADDLAATAADKKESIDRLLERVEVLGKQLSRLNEQLNKGLQVDRQSVRNLEGILCTWAERTEATSQYRFVDQYFAVLDRLMDCIKAQAAVATDRFVQHSLRRSQEYLTKLFKALFWHRAPKEGDGAHNPFHHERQSSFLCSLSAVNAAVGGGDKRISWNQLRAFLAQTRRKTPMQIEEEELKRGGVLAADLLAFIKQFPSGGNARHVVIHHADQAYIDSVAAQLDWPGRRDRIIVNLSWGHFVVLRYDESTGKHHVVDPMASERPEQSLGELIRQACDQPGQIDIIFLDPAKDDPMLALPEQYLAGLYEETYSQGLRLREYAKQRVAQPDSADECVKEMLVVAGDIAANGIRETTLASICDAVQALASLVRIHPEPVVLALHKVLSAVTSDAELSLEGCDPEALREWMAVLQPMADVQPVRAIVQAVAKRMQQQAIAKDWGQPEAPEKPPQFEPLPDPAKAGEGLADAPSRPVDKGMPKRLRKALKNQFEPERNNALRRLADEIISASPSTDAKLVIELAFELCQCLATPRCPEIVATALASLNAQLQEHRTIAFKSAGAATNLEAVKAALNTKAQSTALTLATAVARGLVAGAWTPQHARIANALQAAVQAQEATEEQKAVLEAAINEIARARREADEQLDVPVVTEPLPAEGTGPAIEPAAEQPTEQAPASSDPPGPRQEEMLVLDVSRGLHLALAELATKLPQLLKKGTYTPARALVAQFVHLVDSHQCRPMTSRDAMLVLAELACHALSDRNPSANEFVVSLMDAVVRKCTAPALEWKEKWWNEETLTTRNGRSDFVYRILKSDWIEQGGPIKLPVWASSSVVRTFAAKYAGEVAPREQQQFLPGSFQHLDDVTRGYVEWVAAKKRTDWSDIARVGQIVEVADFILAFAKRERVASKAVIDAVAVFLDRLHAWNGSPESLTRDELGIVGETAAYVQQWRTDGLIEASREQSKRLNAFLRQATKRFDKLHKEERAAASALRRARLLEPWQRAAQYVQGAAQHAQGATQYAQEAARSVTRWATSPYLQAFRYLHDSLAIRATKPTETAVPDTTTIEQAKIPSDEPATQDDERIAPADAHEVAVVEEASDADEPVKPDPVKPPPDLDR